jgi:protease-4
MENAESPPERTIVKPGSAADLGSAIGRWYKSAVAYTPAQITNKAVWSVVIWAVAPLVAGIYLAGYLLPQPAVGVITLDTGISSYTAEFLELQIEKARSDPSIKAVVVKIDTPGGSVVPTQNLYFQLLNLRKDMPVVSAIGSLAASGGYYLAMATDPIFAKPSSTVGNIGVWGYIPSDLAVNDLILASGPFKLSATNQAEFVREIEGIKREFLETVKAGRGERLQMKDHEVLTGLAYSGRESVELGLIDYLGTTNDAILMAAELAGISNNRVVDLELEVLKDIFGDDFSYYKKLERAVLPEMFGDDFSTADNWVYSKNPLTDGFMLPPGAYMLYDVLLGGRP